ncbi:MAG: YqeG family HAD IIIA-type phosphatase [Oscillospiraceae bacterium]|nr:YqeG family HAD IIIA-type phosphatase [Oscillospiraceae bacterium]
MPFSLVPDRLFQRYTDLTPQLLRQLGVRLLLCDLDYTLAPCSVAEPDGALRAWLDGCKEAGVTVMILSNNRSSRRVETFCRDLGIRYVGHAGKPNTRGYREAMALAGEDAGHTAMLGDKLLTDVLGAKRSGVLALMVEPLGGPVGAWNHVLHALQSPFKQISKRRYGKTI